MVSYPETTQKSSKTTPNMADIFEGSILSLILAVVKIICPIFPYNFSLLYSDFEGVQLS